MDTKLFATLRKLEGLSQRQYADKLNVSRSLVTKVEAGDRDLSEDLAERVRRAYTTDQIATVKAMLDGGGWR